MDQAGLSPTRNQPILGGACWLGSSRWAGLGFLFGPFNRCAGLGLNGREPEARPSPIIKKITGER